MVDQLQWGHLIWEAVSCHLAGWLRLCTLSSGRMEASGSRLGVAHSRAFGRASSLCGPLPDVRCVCGVVTVVAAASLGSGGGNYRVRDVGWRYRTGTSVVTSRLWLACLGCAAH